MLTWESLNILSYGAGMPSTTLALMACENALCGPPYPHPQVPVYKVIERFVRRELLCYKPYQRTLDLDRHAHKIAHGDHVGGAPPGQAQ